MITNIIYNTNTIDTVATEKYKRIIYRLSISVFLNGLDCNNNNTNNNKALRGAQYRPFFIKVS